MYFCFGYLVQFDINNPYLKSSTLNIKANEEKKNFMKKKV